MKPELVARGVRFGEGPTWRPDSGDLIVTSVMDGLLWRVDPGDGSAEVFADTAGGPNGSTPCSDGGVLVTQNGGMDFGELGLIPPDQAPRPRYTTPCLQRVGADGAVRELCGIDAGLQAPNDLVIDAENNVIFTDPPHYPPPEGSKGRLLRYRSEDLAPSGAQALDPAGRLEVLAVVGRLHQRCGDLARRASPHRRGARPALDRSGRWAHLVDRGLGWRGWLRLRSRGQGLPLRPRYGPEGGRSGRPAGGRPGAARGRVPDELLLRRGRPPNSLCHGRPGEQRAGLGRHANAWPADQNLPSLRRERRRAGSAVKGERTWA